MEVDFNNLRKDAYYSLGKLISKLNNSITEDSWGDKEVRIDVDEIQRDLDDLRSAVGVITCVGISGNDDFRIICDELRDIPWFNPEDEEDGE